MLIIGEECEIFNNKNGSLFLLLHAIIRGKQSKVFPIVILHYKEYTMN